MLLDIPEEDKACLGYFINYKRKQMVRKDRESYHVESFIEDICSKQTYSRLRKGESIKNNDIYDALLAKLGYHFQYEEQITKKLHAYILKYMPYLSNNKSSLFRKQILAFLPKLTHYQNYALESILYEVCLLITKEDAHSEDLPHMMELYPMLPKDLQEMLGFYILYGILKSNSKKVPITFLKASGLYESDNLYIRYMILTILMLWEYFYDASHYCEQVLAVCKERHEEDSEWAVLITRTYLILVIQPSSFEEALAFIKEYIQVYGDPVSEKRSFLYHISGAYYYQTKEYEKAWSNYIKVKNYPLYNLSKYIFLNSLGTILNRSIPEEVYQYSIKDQISESDQIIYQYYQMKNKKEDVQVLEDYLWNHRNMILQDKDPFSIIKVIIAKELQWIGEQTGNKKRWYQFNKNK